VFEVSLTDERTRRLTAQRLLADRGSSPVRQCLTTQDPFVTMQRTELCAGEPAPLEVVRDVLPRFSQFVTLDGRSTLVTWEPASGGLVALDTFAVFALLVPTAVAVVRTLPLDAFAVAADHVRSLAVAVPVALVTAARGHRVDALAIVIARLIIQVAVAVVVAGVPAVGDGEALLTGRAASEAGVALGVHSADLAARFEFDPSLCSGLFNHDTPEDRGQGATCQATERVPAGRLRGNQRLR
jgi:hypothetical protein